MAHAIFAQPLIGKIWDDGLGAGPDYCAMRNVESKRN